LGFECGKCAATDGIVAEGPLIEAFPKDGSAHGFKATENTKATSIP